jgi:hypothetical protein
MNALVGVVAFQLLHSSFQRQPPHMKSEEHSFLKMLKPSFLGLHSPSNYSTDQQAATKIVRN